MHAWLSHIVALGPCKAVKAACRITQHKHTAHPSSELATHCIHCDTTAVCVSAKRAHSHMMQQTNASHLAACPMHKCWSATSSSRAMQMVRPHPELNRVTHFRKRKTSTADDACMCRQTQRPAPARSSTFHVHWCTTG